MIQKYIPRITVVILGFLIVLGAINAIATSNTISTSRLSQISTAIAINDKKPAACALLNLTNIVVCPTGGGGVCDGTNRNELILGTIGNDTIIGKGGTDCMLGGDGNDDLNGNAGGDVCIGGPGTDTFKKCETIIDP